jgi:hypothetical protein
VNGTLAYGVSLNDLMRELYWAALLQLHEIVREGKAISFLEELLCGKQPWNYQVPGTAWLNDRLDKSLARYGRLPQADLAS